MQKRLFGNAVGAASWNANFSGPFDKSRAFWGLLSSPIFLSARTKYEFKSQLKPCKHILRNSIEFVRKVAGARIPESAFLVRLDTEDFFMSGTVDELASTTIPLIPLYKRNTVRKALTFLLNHRYVVSDLITERTYKVVKGTGMGLRHSGAVADATFFTLVEHDFVAQRTSGMEFFQLSAESASFQTEARRDFMRDRSNARHSSVRVEQLFTSHAMRPLETSEAHSKGVPAWPLARLRAHSDFFWP